MFFITAKELCTPLEAGPPSFEKVYAAAERSGHVDQWQVPGDPCMESYHRAFDEAERRGLINGGVVATCLDDMIDRSIPPVAVSRHHSSSNVRWSVDGGTYRRTPYRKNGHEQDNKGLKETLEELDGIEAALIEEIESPGRIFEKRVTVEDTTTDTGRRTETVEVRDPNEIEEIVEREAAMLGKVISALKVEVFEKTARTRGFPGANNPESEKMVNRGGLFASLRHREDRYLALVFFDQIKRGPNSYRSTRVQYGRDWYWEMVQGYHEWQDYLTGKYRFNPRSRALVTAILDN